MAYSKTAGEAHEVIWITGASSGIGRNLALKLAERGCRVIASARNRDALLQLAAQHERIEALAFDVTVSDEPGRVCRQLEALTPYLDRVVLNAGNCEYLQFPDPDWTMVERIMSVNLFGAVNTLKLALPLLRLSPNRPHIIGIVSQVTGAPFAKAEAYGASKAGLRYFLQSLRVDLAAEGIDVTVVNPGFVDTPLTKKNDFPMPFLMSVEVAVERIIKHALKRPRSYTFPRRLSLLLKLSTVFPGWWQRHIAVPSPSVGKGAKA